VFSELFARLGFEPMVAQHVEAILPKVTVLVKSPIFRQLSESPKLGFSRQKFIEFYM
jgi:hypothetical protein